MKNMLLTASFIMAALHCVSLVSAHSESIPCQDDLSSILSPGNYPDDQDTVDLFVVSGYVKDNSGTGIPGVLVQFNNKSKNTGETGYYQFGAPPNVEITITPSLDGYTFTPAQIFLSDGVASDTTIEDFIGDDGSGTVTDKYTVSGYVKDDTGTGIQAVLVQFNSKQKNTDEIGYYQFEASPNVEISITPSLDGYTFTPAQIFLSDGVASDTTVEDFIGDDGSGTVTDKYYVSGTVRDENNRGMPQVLISFNEKNKNTDEEGRYHFGVDPGVPILITPSMNGYSFEPEEINLPNGVSADLENQDFKGYEGSLAEPVTVTFSGNINLCGEALEDVSVILGNDTVLTNTSGDYSITAEVGLETNVVIDPYKEKYLFVPDSRTVYIDDDQYQDSIDFKARYKGMQSITGKVSHPGLGGGFPGVSVNLQVINQEVATDTAVVTDEQGIFALPYKYGIDGENRSDEYRLTAEKSGYSLSPDEIFFTGEEYCRAVEDHDFVATLNPVPVCLVGVNGENHNMVIWERPMTDAITYFRVYRESDQAEVYELMDSVAYEETGIYTDTVSNPSVKAYRYKIAASTVYGYDTDMSGAHKTIHLTINKGQGNDWNLIWTHYEGLSFLTYKLYRGNSEEDMQLLTDIASNRATYTDLEAPEGMIYYQIAMILLDSCRPGIIQPAFKSEYEDVYSTSKSNIVNNESAGISLEGAQAKDLLLYPNPSDNKLTVRYFKNIEYYELFTLHGKKISWGSVYGKKLELDVSQFPQGFYTLRILTGRDWVMKGFIKK